MSFAAIKAAVATVPWGLVTDYGLDIASLALVAWLGIQQGVPKQEIPRRRRRRHANRLPPTPAAPRAAKFRDVSSEAIPRPRKSSKSLPKPKARRTLEAGASTPDAKPTATPAAPRAAKFYDALRQPSQIEASRPLAATSDLPPKKKVTFVEGAPEVKFVDYWIDPKLHQFKPKRTRWHPELGVVQEFWRWNYSDGAPKLHFPRTKWIRDVPSDEVDDQGDLAMAD
ncbi:MAG: hypothetical protein M1819_002537 [Sarea resinae]|nr:MAG: hypothetical protein M1819_002537 [Sarea resinae]